MTDNSEAKLARLNKILGAFDEGTITTDDFIASFKMVMDFVRQSNDATAEVLQIVFKKLDEFATKLKTDSDEDRTLIKKIVGQAIADSRVAIDSQIASQASKIDAKLLEVKNGEAGKDADEQAVIAAVLAQIPTPKEMIDTPDQVVDKVNTSEKLINADKVAGLKDLERISKLATFNPAMGPSFSDLRDIRSTITTLTNTVNREGAVTINYIIDGGGLVITTGVKGFVEIPYAMTITGWQVFADQSGSVVVDVWKSTYANFPPVVGGSIAGSEKPTLSSAQNNQNLSLSTWTTGLVAGDVLAFNVSSVSTVQRITVSIIGTKV